MSIRTLFSVPAEVDIAGRFVVESGRELRACSFLRCFLLRLDVGADVAERLVPTTAAAAAFASEVV